MDNVEHYDTPVSADDNDAEPNNTTVTVATDNGLLDDDSIAWLTALSVLTKTSTKHLGRQAVDALRQQLVPTTKPSAKASASSSDGAAKRGRTPKAAS